MKVKLTYLWFGDGTLDDVRWMSDSCVNTNVYKIDKKQCIEMMRRGTDRFMARYVQWCHLRIEVWNENVKQVQ